MATKKAPSKSVAKWDEELARRAKISAKMEENSLGLSNTISLKSGQLSYKGNFYKDNKLNAVILDSVLANLYYGTEYDPDNPAAPVCYAFGREESDLVPHEKAPDKQSKACIGCEWNEFGTADKGRGKACKNSRRLVLIMEDSLETGVADAQPIIMHLPVTSVRNYAGYVDQLAKNKNRPPATVVTEISVVPDAKSQFMVRFKHVDDISADHFQAIFDKADGTESLLFAPYTQIEKEEKPARGSKAKPNKAAARGRR